MNVIRGPIKQYAPIFLEKMVRELTIKMPAQKKPSAIPPKATKAKKACKEEIMYPAKSRSSEKNPVKKNPMSPIRNIRSIKEPKCERRRDGCSSELIGEPGVDKSFFSKRKTIGIKKKADNIQFKSNSHGTEVY